MQAPATEPSPTRAHHLKVLALVTGGIGVLAVGAGVAMGLRASSLSTEVSNDAKMMMYSQSKFDSGERAQTLEIVGYSVGAAALIASGILYYLGCRERTRCFASRPLRSPIGTGGFGTALRMSF